MVHMIVGTAGHIDHGKTTLIKALTGNDTDTLAEEKKRGISINLGFTSFPLPSGAVLGVVDVPGHEKFVKNMLAGAAGIDVALIIVAANEGIMPQTREHIDILSFLNIKKSIIVITKIDMVDKEFKELVIADVEEYIEGTFLTGSKIIEVDSVSRKGLDTLIAELEQLTRQVRPKSSVKKPRLNVDRIFSVKGHGTVVTGTLLEGKIQVEDKLILYPQFVETKVRNLQVHDQNVTTAYAGQRTAINLSNLSAQEVKRGDTVAWEDSVHVTDIMDVSFTMVKNTKFEMERFYKLKVYIGASEEVGRIVPITTAKAKAGEQGYAQILLERKVAVRKGDCFVLRTITPVATIGGGYIIDPIPKRHRQITPTLIEALRVQDSDSEVDIVAAYIKTHPFLQMKEIVAFINRELTTAEQTELFEDGRVMKLETCYIHQESVDEYQMALEDELNQYHKQHQLRAGISKAQLLKTLWGLEKKQSELLFQYFLTQKVIKADRNMVALYEFSPKLSEVETQLKKQMEQQLHQSQFQLLTAKELTGGNLQSQQVLDFMIAQELVSILGGYILSQDLYKKAYQEVLGLGDQQRTIKLSEFRDRIQTSRKYALLLLEKFDQDKVTKRQGEDRVLVAE